MAHKRMFSKDVTTSDAFREMPTSTQALYFHLGMEADDDGFLDNYKGLMRAVGSSEDDLKILLGKRFLLPRENGILVVKHWLINNTIRKDRYQPTRHIEAKNGLFLKENKSYTDNPDSGIPLGNHLATQYRIGKDRKEEYCEQSSPVHVFGDIEDHQPKQDTRRTKDKLAIYSLFGGKKPWWTHAQQRQAALRLFDDPGFEQVKRAMEFYNEHKDDKFCPTITTPFKLEEKWSELFDFKKRNNL